MSERKWVDFISYCSDFPAGKQLIVYRLHRHEVDDELTMLAKRRKEFLALVDTIQNNIEESVWQA